MQIYAFLDCVRNNFAGFQGIEPQSTVLATVIIPLYQKPVPQFSFCPPCMVRHPPTRLVDAFC